MIKFHHIDIREYYDSVIDYFRELDDMIKFDIDIDDCDIIIKILTKIAKHYPKIRNLFTTNLDKSNISNKQKYILNKLLNHYNNNHVKAKITYLMQQLYHDLGKLENLCLELIVDVLEYQNLLLQPEDVLRKTNFNYDPYAYGALEVEINNLYIKLFHSYSKLKIFHVNTFIKLMDYFFFKAISR